MVKHTIQEIANFFRCPVSKDLNGLSVFVTKETPIKTDTGWFRHIFTHDNIRIHRQFISDIDAHDWSELITPSR